jgi:hypothetical protein
VGEEIITLSDKSWYCEIRQKKNIIIKKTGAINLTGDGKETK